MTLSAAASASSSSSRTTLRWNRYIGNPRIQRSSTNRPQPNEPESLATHIADRITRAGVAITSSPPIRYGIHTSIATAAARRLTVVRMAQYSFTQDCLWGGHRRCHQKPRGTPTTKRTMTTITGPALTPHASACSVPTAMNPRTPKITAKTASTAAMMVRVALDTVLCPLVMAGPPVLVRTAYHRPVHPRLHSWSVCSAVPGS